MELEVEHVVEGHSLYRGSDGGRRGPPLPSRLAAQGRGAGCRLWRDVVPCGRRASVFWMV